MTKFGSLSANLQEIVVFEVSPMCVRDVVWTDLAGTYFERQIKICNIATDEDNPNVFVLNLY